MCRDYDDVEKVLNGWTNGDARVNKVFAWGIGCNFGAFTLDLIQLIIICNPSDLRNTGKMATE